MVDKQSFFAEHYAYARSAGLSDVQARLAVSQAAVETGWGKVGQAVKGNNFFGMKIGDDWTGKSINLPTREETKKGKSYTVKADFRQYETPVDAYRDWAKKMEKNWPGVMKATNFNEAVEALNHGVKGVYATENDYGQSLKSVNRSLEKSGVIGLRAAAKGFPDIGASPFGAYRDLVPAHSVKTTSVKAKPPGLAALAPNGLVGQITNRDQKVIDSLHPDYREQARSFLAETKAQGLNIGLVPTTGGYRTKAQQAAIKATGTIAASPSNSYHNYGIGFDYAPLDANNVPSWDKTDPRWDQAGQIATDLGMQRSIEGDLGHVTPTGFPARVPGSIKTAKQFTDPTNGLSYPELSDQQAFAVSGANPYASMAKALKDNAVLAELSRPHPEFTAPIGQVERSPLADVPSLASLAPDRQMPSGAVADAFPSLSGPMNFPGMSIPADVASPHRMADLGGITGYLAEHPALTNSISDNVRSVPGMSIPGDTASPRTMAALGGLSGFLSEQQAASLPPDRQMPSGPVSTDFAPPTASPPRPDNLNYAGPKGMFGVAPNLTSPAMMAPALSAPTAVKDYNVADVISPTPGAPASPTVDPTGTFPDAPAGPSTFSKVKDVVSPIAKNAMLGLKVGGPIGALAAPALGLLGDKLGIGLSHLGPGFDNAVQDRVSTGFGLNGINAAMGGPKGAQGFSLSNPGSSFTSLGPGMGGLRRSDKYGWTEHVNDAGSVIGISYDNPQDKGIFGKISASMNGKFGGGLSEKGSKAIAGGKGGLY